MNQTPTLPNILLRHLQEWQSSGVCWEIIQKNVISISGNSIYDHLCTSDNIKRLNTGRLPSGILKSYRTLEEGGWWVSGVDLLTHESSLWGQYKPDNPRIVPSKSPTNPDESGKSPDEFKANPDESGKSSKKKTKRIKYEVPLKTPTEIIALRVPLSICKKIASRYGLEYDKDPKDFWKWVIKNPAIPVLITEGAKKAGALLTQGFAAVALPGIYNGYRTRKDQFGNPLAPPKLIPQLKVFATKDRKIYFAFDNDIKEKTRMNVRKATKTTAELFQKEGCKTYVISWFGEDKGVDDLIVNQGGEVFERLYKSALELAKWQINNAVKLSYKPDVEVDSRYLPELSMPEDANLILIKAPKGTGKTYAVKQAVSQYLHDGERQIIVLSHRVQLCQYLCNEFGIDYQTYRFSSETKGVFGIGLCVDSSHKKSGARFDPDDWHGAIIIIDEAEQVLWHMLNSSTCKPNRVAILRNIKKLIKNSFKYGGKLFMADADLSDIAIDWVYGIAGKCRINRWLLVNDYKPENPWDIYHYEHKTADGMVAKLVEHIKDGGRPFICTSAQKANSKFGTQALEKYLKDQFPELEILRIDAETMSDPKNAAYVCLTDLNTILKKYHIVIASPAIETGLSIECTLDDGITPYFTSVWGIAQGVQTTNSVCQALARVRAPVPRHIWINKIGLQKAGNGRKTLHGLLGSSKRQRDFNIKLLMDGGLPSADSIDLELETDSLAAWAKRAITINIAKSAYRETIISALKEEGHNIIDSSDYIAGSEEVNESLKACKTELYEAECQKIVEVGNPNDTEYQKLKDQRSKTEEERNKYRHGYLFRAYGIPVDEKLIKQDDKKWYSPLRLHYHLTRGREFVNAHDANNAVNQIIAGEGSIFTPDFNTSQVRSKIWMLEMIGIHEILENKQRREDSDFIVRAGEFVIKYHQEYRDAFGINPFKKDGTPKTNMTIVLSILKLLGLKCARLRKVTVGDKRVYLYSAPMPDYEKNGNKAIIDEWDCPIPIMDRRDEVFDFWHKSDIARYNNQENPYLKLVKTSNSKEINNDLSDVAVDKPEMTSRMKEMVDDVRFAISLGKEHLKNFWESVEETWKENIKPFLSGVELEQLGRLELAGE